MSHHRQLSQKNKWYLEPEVYNATISYALQYPVWKKQLRQFHGYDLRKAIAYDGEKVQTSNEYDPVSTTAIENADRQQDLIHKIKLVEDTAKEVAPEIYEWLILAVTRKDMPYFRLRQQGIPCGEDYFYDRKHCFYFELSKKI